MKTTINKALILLLMGFILIKAPVYADEVNLDYPHCSTYDLACLSCHYMFDGSWPVWVTNDPDNIDDTPYNNLCRSCHNDVTALDVKTHSSLTTSDQYGDWSIECRTCHDPHHQRQLRIYDAESYIDTNISTAITFNTLTRAGANWTENQYQGYTLVPNLDELSYNYKITINDPNTLTIDGYMNKREEDFERVDFTIFPWSTGGDAVWTDQNTTKHAGEYAAEAPTSLGDNQMSYLQARLKITGTGNISFWYKVSSEPADDYLRFLIDGEEQGRWSGEEVEEWAQESYSVSDGWRTFRWEYTKGPAGSAGSDTAWIDDITFPTKVTLTVGDPFAVIYGKLIRNEIPTPNSRNQTVKFFNPTGDNSFADGDSTYDGVCEVCHTKPDHFRNDGSGSEPLHENISEGQAGANCMYCHSHENGFGHGAGGDPGTGCGTSTSCHGELASHPVHVTNEGMQTPLDCTGFKGTGFTGCHDEGDFLKFADGNNLGSTTVCDTCHSPGGLFNGVADSTIGAKANWDNGAYDGDTLRPGKEKWCVGCHDAGPSIIAGVSAPDIGGDDATYGYFVNGHGKSGFSKKCTDCHDPTLLHIDGNAPTFSNDYTVASYNDGYRLIQPEGQPALEVPRSGSFYDPNDFTLCFSCHNQLDVLGVPADYNQYQKSISPDAVGLELPAGTTSHTNFRNELGWGQAGWYFGLDAPSNAHWDHIITTSLDWDLDYTTGAGSINSITSCVTCHNPHGTKDDWDEPTVKMTRGDMDITFDSYDDGLTVHDYGYIGSDDYLWYIDQNSDLSCAGCHVSGKGVDPAGGTRYYRLPWQTPVNIADSSAGGFDDPNSLCDDATSIGSTIADANQWVSFDLGASYLVSEVRLFASSTITSQWNVYVSTDTNDWGDTAVKTTWQVGSDSGGANRWYGTSVINKLGRYIKLEGARTNGTTQDQAIFEFDFLWDIPWISPTGVMDTSTDKTWSSPWQTPATVVASDVEFGYTELLIDGYVDKQIGAILGWMTPAGGVIASENLTEPENLCDNEVHPTGAPRYALTGSAFQDTNVSVTFDLGAEYDVTDVKLYANSIRNWIGHPGGQVPNVDWPANAVVGRSPGFNDPNNLVDNDPDTFSTLAIGNQWVTYDLGKDYYIFRFAMAHKQGDPQSEWDVYVSIDGTNWGDPAVTGWEITEGMYLWIFSDEFTPKLGRYIKLEGSRTSQESGDPIAYAFAAEVTLIDTWDVWVGDGANWTLTKTGWSYSSSDGKPHWHAATVTPTIGDHIKLDGIVTNGNELVFEFDFRHAGSTAPYGATFDLGSGYGLSTNLRLCAAPNVESTWDVYVSPNSAGPWTSSNRIITDWTIAATSDTYQEWKQTSVTDPNIEHRYMRIEGEQDPNNFCDVVVNELAVAYYNPEDIIDGDFDTGSGLTYIGKEESVSYENVGDGDGITTVFYLDHGLVVEPPKDKKVWVDWVLQTEHTHYELNYENGAITFNTAPASGLSIYASYYYLTGPPAEVVFDMGGTCTVDYVRLYGYACSPSLNTVWDVHVSPDPDGDWTAIITGWKIDNSQNQWYVHDNDLDPNMSGHYIKLTGRRNSAAPDSGNWTMLKEFQFHVE